MGYQESVKGAVRIMTVPKKLLFLVNVDWFFVSHRLPVALAAIDAGYEVHLACGITDKKEQLESLGLVVHSLPLSRSGTGLVAEYRAFTSIWQLLKQLQPDVLHMVTVKAVVYGGVAARMLGIAGRVASMSGLGFVFIDSGVKAKLLRLLISRIYSFAFNGRSSVKPRVIFQNATDLQLFVDSNILKPAQAELIPGSGVDLHHFDAASLPMLCSSEAKPVVMFVARLLKDKGVLEFCDAAAELRYGARFVIVGDLDPGNPNSLSELELQGLQASGVVEWWGFSDNVAATLAQADLVVLPSYREGLPKSLIEAAACGRPVVTTDVPGCRDAIIPDKTGVLVAVRDSKALIVAVGELLDDPARLLCMGRAGRAWAERQFDVRQVIDRHLEIYEQVGTGEH